MPQTIEAFDPAGQDLVNVGLVPGVPDDDVLWGTEDAVQGDGEFHDAQIRTEMAPRGGHLGHEELADLGGEIVELLRIQGSHVARVPYPLQQPHGPPHPAGV